MIINNKDTIAAIATPAGNSGIGIIRISGDNAIETADKVIRSRSGKSLDLFSVNSHTVHYGYVYDDEKKEILDEVLCTVYRTPRSYTSEDTVEINCHGGMFVLNRVLSLILSKGIRLAEPGEFTRRAFLNGRIDLSQAESVMDLISSENEFSRSNSLSQLRGSIKETVTEIREIIIHETAFIEAALDDPEHYDIDDDHKRKLKEKINNILLSLSDILKNSDNVRFLKNGINTVITGKPNVGKSSLLNMFAGYDRAIVTNVPGTTRDVITERVSVDEIILNIIDTAGIHESDDEVENIGIKKAEGEIERSDLVLFMTDASGNLDEEDIDILRKLNNKTCIAILNKTDKGIVLNEHIIKDISDIPVIQMSIKEKTGINELKEKIKEFFIKEEIRNDEIYITNKRQEELFRKAYNSLMMVNNSIDDNMSEDVYTVDLMDAYFFLGEIIGEDISDDLADRIFSEFCMGK